MIPENNDYLTKQLITYIGNKRALLDFIGRGVDEARRRLGRETFTFADMFSGSGVVSRYVKRGAGYILSNDLEGYCRTIAMCYLASPDREELRVHYEFLLRDMAEHPVKDGFVRRLYSPQAVDNIRAGERVFYTPENAGYIDTCRAAIDRLPEEVRCFFLAPLLAEASVKCNTAGVFKGFYKDRATGVGAFGGSGRNALSRIMARIELPFPVFSRFECPFDVEGQDANALARTMDRVDIAYIDPPYNQHPYGSNYFMLNLINEGREPREVSRVSGIPKVWNRSDYNKKALARERLGQLCQDIPARFLLVSFNSEGFISRTEMEDTLSRIGELQVFDTTYNVFRGCRNLSGRDIHNSEFLYIVDKG